MCITKPNRESAHEHITHVGLSDGSYLTRDKVIQMINNGHQFYVLSGSQKAYVGVVDPVGSRPPHIRTYADGYWNDNLLSLSECVLK